MFTIDTGFPVTVMPNNQKLYNQKDIISLKERYQDMNKNENNCLCKIWTIIEYNGETTKLPLLITQRGDITTLLGVNWVKQLPITINKISLATIPTSQATFTLNSTNYSKRTVRTDQYHTTYRKT